MRSCEFAHDGVQGWGLDNCVCLLGLYMYDADEMLYRGFFK